MAFGTTMNKFSVSFPFFFSVHFISFSNLHYH
jgi:hypothetical protein